ncbi:MAG: SDR family oxidoreductase [Bacteroidales bacterium]|nr:SDR family oxidoreductase [Bacteroidales bacterium]
MKILITGATGYIGSGLAKKLASSGHTVHALIRSPEKAGLIRHENIHIFEGTILQPDKIEKAITGCQQVYHLAAYAKPWARDSSTFFRINTLGTDHILKAAFEHKISKVVFTSTAGTFNPSFNKPVNEDTLRLIDFFNDYETSKFIAEERCQKYIRKGLNVVIVNPPRLYGPGLLSKSNAVTLMIKRYSEGRWRIIPDNGDKVGNYVFIDDVIKGHILAMDKGRSGEKYLLGGENISYSGFFDTLAKVCGKKYKMINLPYSVMMVASGLFLFWTRISGRPPLITPEWVKKYLYNWALSSQKAIDELGYQITPLETGMQKTIDWIRKQSE